jgi:multidrug efflux system membrane fusion protein
MSTPEKRKTATPILVPPGPGPQVLRTRPRRWWLWLLALAVLLGVGYRLFLRSEPSQRPAAEQAARPAMPPVPILAVAARSGDMPVYLTGLGSVAAFNTVTVKSRVDGQLVSVAFKEGQLVHAGDVLAEIDPRPYQVQLAQAEGQMARDAAQLKNAQIVLTRTRELLERQLVAKQQLDDAAAQLGQFEGAIKTDQAAIDNAKLQLSYSRIVAPISGRIGLRLVDVGNMVHASDQNGLLVITQVQPIAVLFTMPEDDLPPILKKLHAGENLTVEAFDRANRRQIATGSLLTTDNQIDQSTGTTRLKAVFPNDDEALFPNQFVNVRLLLETQSDAIIVPNAAIQRGPQGTFVYVVEADHTVEVRPVTLGAAAGGETAIASGLSAGEQVVTDGVEKLRAGSAVQLRTAEPDAAHHAPKA